MNRGYTRTEYLALIERIRSAIPGIALSTDIIVGFPGETEGDFADTLDLFDRVGFDHAFTFIYSPREGTPAASMPDQIERAVAQDRFDRLTARVRDSALTANSAEVGMEVEILVEGESKRDSRILSGRTPQRRLVHVPAPDSAADAAAGRMALVRINEAQSWFLRGEFIEWLTDTPAQSLSRIGSGG
jgi:tRNA-2-methylthio-N6-dimethylallyladenosine synthase